jgi:hypothetical protein
MMSVTGLAAEPQQVFEQERPAPQSESSPQGKPHREKVSMCWRATGVISSPSMDSKVVQQPPTRTQLLQPRDWQGNDRR